MRGWVWLPLFAACAGNDDAPTDSDGGTNVVTLSTDADVVWEDLVRLEVEVHSGLIALGSFDTPQTSVTVGGGEPGDTYGNSEDAGVGSVWALCATAERGCNTGFDLVVPHDLTVILSTFAGPVNVIGHEGPLNISSNMGPVTVTQRPASPLVVITQAGTVDVTYAEDPTNLEITTTSGDIVVSLPGQDYTIDVDSPLGTVTLEGVRNVPGGPTVRLVSTDGDILLQGTGA